MNQCVINQLMGPEPWKNVAGWLSSCVATAIIVGLNVKAKPGHFPPQAPPTGVFLFWGSLYWWASVHFDIRSCSLSFFGWCSSQWFWVDCSSLCYDVPWGITVPFHFPKAAPPSSDIMFGSVNDALLPWAEHGEGFPPPSLPPTPPQTSSMDFAWSDLRQITSVSLQGFEGVIQAHIQDDDLLDDEILAPNQNRILTDDGHRLIQFYDVRRYQHQCTLRAFAATLFFCNWNHFIWTQEHMPNAALDFYNESDSFLLLPYSWERCCNDNDWPSLEHQCHVFSVR